MDSRNRTEITYLTGKYAGFRNVNLPMVTRIEAITSVRGKKILPLAWNPCSHTKCEVISTISGTRPTYNGFPYIYTNLHGPLIGLISAGTIDGALTMTRESWEGVMDHCDLGVATKVSLPNFLIDCADMRRACKSLASKINSRTPKQYRNRGNTATRSGALWLFYSYGIKPFISDLSNILTCQRRVLAKAAKMRAARGVRRRVTTNVKPTNGWRGSISLDCLKTGLIQDIRFKTSTSATGKFMMSYTPSVNVDVSALKLALNYLGVNKVGDVIWDAIPYSFVVDWFIDTQRWVRELNINNFTFPFTVHSAGCQVSGIMDCQVLAVGYDNRPFPPQTVMLKSFVRSCGYPGLASGSLLTDRFHVRQASYAASLLAQFLK